jgi:hypothetical protein
MLAYSVAISFALLSVYANSSSIAFYAASILAYGFSTARA